MKYRTKYTIEAWRVGSDNMPEWVKTQRDPLTGQLQTWIPCYNGWSVIVAAEGDWVLKNGGHWTDDSFKLAYEEVQE
jgi:hypothetical protein